jgi:PAS domain S-box-containing protein
VAAPAPELLLAAIVDSSDDAIISKTLEGVVTSWNRSAERIFGYTPAEAVGRSIKDLLFPADRRDEEDDILRRVRRGERVDHFETVRQRKDGSRVEVSVTISPIRDATGAIVGVSKVARDISDQKKLGEASVLLAAIVNSSEDAIVSKSLEGVITSWNAGAERVFGYTSAEAVGQPVLMLVPADRKTEEPHILARLKRGERVEHFETIRVRKNGEHFPVSLTISPVKNAAGVVVGASKIARDITELKRVTAEREQLLASERAARAEAEQANRMKDDFIATVSHELRTPLNAIVGWTQVLRDSTDRPAEVAQGIDVIERNAFAQSQLINDLLDIGRMTSGKMTLEVQPVEITTVILDAIGSVRPTAELKGIQLKTILDSPGVAMMGDKQRLQQVIWNLVANAIKFTPKHGHVTVTLHRVNSHVEIGVADDGRGIAADFLPHVFERFRQADASTTRQFGGLGIGLALVKQLVELHGGSVRVESPGLEQGAVFTVSLPVRAAHAERTTAARSHQEAPASPVPSEDLSGISVLVVDDDTDSLEVMKRILVSRHAEVRTAASALEALEIFPSFHPQVILSDIGMPVHDGYELIRRIRQLPGGAFVPAAALTALARADDRMRALQAGFQTHVAKPIAPQELMAVVRSLGALHSSPAAPGAGT